MKYLIHIFFSILITLNVSRAQVSFQKTYGGIYDDEALCIQQTSDQGYVMCGYSKSFNGNANKDAYVVKTDLNGALVWAYTYGGNNDQQFHYIVETNDGGYIATGFNYADGVNNSIYIVRLDRNGAIVWSQNLDGYYGTGLAVKQAKDNNFLVAGVTGIYPDLDAYVAKLDVSGNIIWQKTYGDPGNNDFSGLAELPDGNIICVGSTSGSNGLAANGGGQHDGLIVKLDNNGNFLGALETGGIENEGFRSVTVSNAGELFVAGNSFETGSPASAVLKIKSDLTGVDWTTLIGKAGSNNRCWSNNITAKGELISAVAYNAVTANNDAHLILLNSTGNLIWSKTYGGTSGDEVKFCNQTADGGYFAAGYTSSFGAGGMDMYFIRTDENGDIKNLSCPVINSTLQVSNPTFIYANNKPELIGKNEAKLVYADVKSNTATSSNFSCNCTASITVNNDTSICAGNSVQLSASSGFDSYSWAPAAGLSSTTIPNPIATPTITTTYTVTGTNVDGCVRSDTVTVTLQPCIITVSVSPMTLCAGSSGILTAVPGGNGVPGYNYAWSPAIGLSATTGASVTANPAATTTYTVVITDSSTPAKTNSTTVVVTVNPLPTITVASKTICAGTSTELIAFGANTYKWANGTGLNTNTGAKVVANPTTTTTYTITGTSPTGCTGTNTATVTVNAAPIIKVNTANICQGEVATLSATGADSYSWGPLGTLSPDTGATVTARPLRTTTYTITGTDRKGCTATTSISVLVAKKPIAAFTCFSKEDLFSTMVYFTDKTTGGPIVNWNWEFGDPDNSTSAIQNPTFTYFDRGGEYKVKLRVVNQSGCVDTTSLNVFIKGPFTFYIPNTFSPNDDYTNDNFMPKGSGVDEENYDFQIFDKWGNLIWDTNTWGEAWDGKMKGKSEIVQTDVYVWKIHLREKVSHHQHSYIGHVNVVK